MLLGYARVSTIDQNLALQRDALAETGCGRIFTEQLSGAVTDYSIGCRRRRNG
jgi:DNA invertase Pin-like site-specific DNA recombinase